MNMGRVMSFSFPVPTAKHRAVRGLACVLSLFVFIGSPGVIQTQVQAQDPNYVDVDVAITPDGSPHGDLGFISFTATTHFTLGDPPFYVDEARRALAINAGNPALRHGFSSATAVYPGPSGRFDVTITTLTEVDGESTYHVYVNDERVGTHTNPTTEIDYAPSLRTWSNVTLNPGDTLRVEACAHTNGRIPEGDATAWARGRWQHLGIAPSIEEVLADADPIQLVRRAGRLIISSDGNHHDPDDIAASAAGLTMLAHAGLQDQLIAYTFSDHVWGSFGDREEQMRRSVVETGERNGFTNTNFIEAVTDPEAAYAAVRDAVNASTAEDPLTIIAGGPMEVTWQGINASNPEARAHVLVISHSTWNNNHGHEHDGHDFADIGELGVATRKIVDQNSVDHIDRGLSSNEFGAAGWAAWQWLRDHENANCRWAYTRMRAARRADISDAGMVYFWLTGDENAHPTLLRRFFAEPANFAEGDEIVPIEAD